VSFAVRQYEILGVAGVSGTGQKELFDVLVGVGEVTHGQVLFGGKDITNRSPRFIAQQGLASVPEDRIHQGLAMSFRVDENLILGLHRESRFRRGPFLAQGEISAFADELVRDFDIATPSPGRPVRTLSGGNLQKVILARELSRDPECLIVSQPSRGLDVGASEYVRRLLLAKRRRGGGILLFSEDLDELFMLADRLVVMYDGQIVGRLNPRDVSREEVGLLMCAGGETCEVGTAGFPPAEGALESHYGPGVPKNRR
jgi:simple sugar transport system ATP-binding protein